MKKFTVKDFIIYNSPCFSCKGESNFYFEIDTTDTDNPNFTSRISKRAMVITDYTEVELVIHYANNLLIKIEHKTNKFTTSSMEALVKYLSNRRLSMRIVCARCAASVETNCLDFNLEKMFIYPTTINNESYLVSDIKYTYHVFSRFDFNKRTLLTISNNDKVKKNINTNAQQIELPLLPLYKFKTKEKFLNKIKTYLTFS